MSVDLESLRCFLAAARVGQFRRAAAQVALSPSAFSARLKSLEEATGSRLFERTTRKVQLTPAGDALVPLAEAALEAVERCARLSSAEQAPFSVTLGTRFELGLSWLQPALDTLRPKQPGRTIHLAFANGADLIERVRRGQIDAAVTSFRIAAPDLAYAALHEERYVLVVAPNALSALPDRSAATHQPTEPPNLEEFRKFAPHLTLLDVDDTLPLFRYLLDVLPPEPALYFSRMQWLGTIAAIRQRLLAGSSIAVLPRYFVQPDLDAGHLLELLPELEPRRDCFRLVWLRDHPRTDDLHALAAELLTFPLQ